IPFIFPGMTMSMSTMSGERRRAFSMLSSPDAAMPTTSYPRAVRRSSSCIVMMASSSTTRIFDMLLLSPEGYIHDHFRPLVPPHGEGALQLLLHEGPHQLEPEGTRLAEVEPLRQPHPVVGDSKPDMPVLLLCQVLYCTFLPALEGMLVRIGEDLV